MSATPLRTDARSIRRQSTTGSSTSSAQRCQPAGRCCPGTGVLPDPPRHVPGQQLSVRVGQPGQAAVPAPGLAVGAGAAVGLVFRLFLACEFVPVLLGDPPVRQAEIGRLGGPGRHGQLVGVQVVVDLGVACQVPAALVGVAAGQRVGGGGRLARVAAAVLAQQVGHLVQQPEPEFRHVGRRRRPRDRGRCARPDRWAVRAGRSASSWRPRSVPGPGSRKRDRAPGARSTPWRPPISAAGRRSVRRVDRVGTPPVDHRPSGLSGNRPAARSTGVSRRTSTGSAAPFGRAAAKRLGHQGGHVRRRAWSPSPTRATRPSTTRRRRARWRPTRQR